MQPRVIGLDLSLTSTGFATPDGACRITSKGSRGDSITQRHERLNRLLLRIMELAHEADLVVIEQPAYSRTQGSQHDRSGLWWLVVDALLYRSVTVVEVAPTARARYATGRGNASKDEVLAAVVRRYPDVAINGNDEADAYVLMAMGLDHLGCPVVEVPKAHRAALDKVDWPEVRGGH
jgi:crossover junction endodeoxyribonuclease RuvC